MHGQVHISDTISNRSPIFSVFKDCKVYIFNWKVHLTLTSLSWFNGYCSAFFVLVCFSYTVCNRSTIFSVWDDCKVCMSSCQVSSVVKVKFLSYVFFSNTICNRSTIFGVWKCLMIYMSVAHVLFDRDLIFMVH